MRIRPVPLKACAGQDEAILGKTAVIERPFQPQKADLHLHFESSPFVVGDVVETILNGVLPTGPDDPAAGTIEIVVAEVINNIIEHAYGGRPGQPIEVAVVEGALALDFHFRDLGRPMPGGRLPDGSPRNLDVTRPRLPEGGFGWLLIRKLVSGLRYWRSGDTNHLCFSIPKSESISTGERIQ